MSSGDCARESHDELSPANFAVFDPHRASIAIDLLSKRSIASVNLEDLSGACSSGSSTEMCRSSVKAANNRNRS
ncbi:hypothetical protein [Halalkalirubrum salinum]|uniref:hypothetical protein n=1 Tax=Halalkalirubrum salinum TaxID=2563889 RepID=UPI0010FBAC6F|nr:hypothetical protein [Halalkalirubrum salinum]